ncbi:MAG: hypothetical protein IJ751_01435 [Oscillospiraceae bacterium]|nr:hypothetical protein [Oscillospiraceae bacterium]
MYFELLTRLEEIGNDLEAAQDTFELIIEGLDDEGFSRKDTTIDPALAVNFARRFPAYMSALALLSGKFFDSVSELNRVRDDMEAEWRRKVETL